MNKENIDSELNTSLNEIDAVNSSYHITVNRTENLPFFFLKKIK